MSQPPPEPLTSRQAADLAGRHGLRRLGARPRIGAYIKALWHRRHFIRVLATSDAMGRNQGSYLGQLWAVLNPLLQFAVFFLVFGLMMDMRGGTDDFISYLAIGTFLFGFMASGLTTGAKAVFGRINLVRALEFPRAVLPISVALTELIMMWPALVVMVIVLIIRGQPITWSWLLLPVDLAMMYAFTLGFAFILARVCSVTPDLANLVPIGTQLARFLSGVFFNISLVAGAYPTLAWICEHQPFGLYLKLARGAMMTVDGPNTESMVDQPYEWAMGAGWAILFLGIGFVAFWQAEARYGRD